MNRNDSVGAAPWWQTLGNMFPNPWNTATQDTAPQPPDDNMQAKEELPPEHNPDLSQETNNSNAATEVNQEKSVPVERPDELIAALYLLRCDTVKFCEKKLRAMYEKTQNVAKDQQLLHDVQRKLMECVKDDGKCDLTALRKTPEWKELSKKVQGISINLPDKDVLSKEEKDLYLRILENRDKDYDRDLKLCMQESQQCIQERDRCYAELKTLWDKHSEIIKKILANVPSR